jgi:FkbM family methyltransferase
VKRLQTAVGPLYGWNEDDVTRYLLEHPFWDAHLKPAIDDTPTDGWAIDIGANIGFFTIYLARRFEKVLAIEAHPQTAWLLGCNLRLNHIQNVLLVEGAAYDRPGVALELARSDVHRWPEGERSFADLDSVPHSAGFTFVENPAQMHALHEVRVATICVDQLVPESAQVRLLKIDCQGAALRALVGAEETITRCRPRVVFEFEDFASELRGDDWSAYVAWFEAHRYDLTRIPGPWADYLAVPR